MVPQHLKVLKTIHNTLQKVNLPDINFKPKQVEVFQQILNQNDVIAVLPTGYGKSILFQILPMMIPKKCERNIVIVLTPLNSIISDQIESMRKYNIAAAVLQDFSFTEPSIPSLFEVKSEQENDSSIEIPQQIENGNISILLCHPEALLSDYGRKLMRSEVYQKNVVAIVIDEVHCIQTWGENFRVEFSNLASIRSYFPTSPMLALTATATTKSIKDIEKSLNMQNVKVLRISPNRKNLFLCRRKRTDMYDGINSYNNILVPIANKLKLLGKDYPQTIIYLKLQYCGHAYMLFKRIIGKIYGDKERSVSNCLIAQYHAPQTDQMKSEILIELMKSDSNIRVIFASPALGMGVNMPYVTNIIHISPPSSLEEYTQAIGRAGRTGMQSTAILYFCNSEISNLKVKQNLVTEQMVRFCETEECLRKHQLNYFDFILDHNQVHCCSNCNDFEETEGEKIKKRNLTKENKGYLLNAFNNFLAEKDTILPDEEYFHSFDIFLYKPDTIETLSGKMMIIVDNISTIMNEADLLQYGILNESDSHKIFALVEIFSHLE